MNYSSKEKCHKGGDNKRLRCDDNYMKNDIYEYEIKSNLWVVNGE
jgi:hypothetical protein